MNQTTEFLNKFRYVLLAALIVITAGYGYYLYSLYKPAPQSDSQITVPVEVMTDGAIRIDGTVYTTVEMLEPKVNAIQELHPGISFTISAANGAQFEPISKAVYLLQRSKAKTIWVVNQKSKPPNKPSER